MGVSFKAWLARDPEEWNGADKDRPWTKRLFWHRNFYPCVDIILMDLHEKDLLKDGDYVIDIDW